MNVSNFQFSLEVIRTNVHCIVHVYCITQLHSNGYKTLLIIQMKIFYFGACDKLSSVCVRHLTLKF